MEYQTADRIYLIYNHWEWKPRAVLSLLIRIFTCGPNHLAIKEGDVVKEMVGSSFKWIIKRLLGKPVSYAPNEGCGYKVTPLEEWLKHTNRKVIEMKPLQPLEIVEIQEGYGFLDLIQAFFDIIRRVWFLIGHDWNGKSGTKFWSGTFCSEYGAKKLGIAGAHRMFPVNFLSLKYADKLEYVGEFETRKD